VIGLSLLVLTPHVTTAHFALRSPASWRTQDFLGNPQKMGPCGDEDDAPTTGVVTAFAPGETITITLDETIFHPGHYRVALAVQDRSELPPEPPVTPGTTACGSAPIATPPTFPVLADGVLQHTDPFPDTRFIQVTLPSDVTCTRCTLQVLEFMSDHPAPCFYHHCADISIGIGGASCGSDGECADDNVCTTDRCDPVMRTCEHVDTVTAGCDDGNACTSDACSATQGCVTQPITLADVNIGLIDPLQTPPCSQEQIPRAIEKLLDKAATLVTRAGRTPAKADRLLRRASGRLHKAAKKVSKARGRSLSTECATALDAALGQAQTRVQCPRSATAPFVEPEHAPRDKPASSRRAYLFFSASRIARSAAWNFAGSVWASSSFASCS